MNFELAKISYNEYPLIKVTLRYMIKSLLPLPKCLDQLVRFRFSVIQISETQTCSSTLILEAQPPTYNSCFYISGGMMSVFLMGVYDKSCDKFRTVAKCGNGHDDATLAKLQKELDMVKISKVSKKYLFCFQVQS